MFSDLQMAAEMLLILLCQSITALHEGRLPLARGTIATWSIINIFVTICRWMRELYETDLLLHPFGQGWVLFTSFMDVGMGV